MSDNNETFIELKDKKIAELEAELYVLDAVCIRSVLKKNKELQEKLKKATNYIMERGLLDHYLRITKQTLEEINKW